jgi:hypothetical protein
MDAIALINKMWQCDVFCTTHVPSNVNTEPLLSTVASDTGALLRQWIYYELHFHRKISGMWGYNFVSFLLKRKKENRFLFTNVIYFYR